MSILVDVAVPPLKQAFTYAVPEENFKEIDVGYKVEVPLGRRKAAGYVVSKFPLAQNAESVNGLSEIKNLLPTKELHRCFSPGQLEFLRWVAEYYGDSLSNVIDTAVPKPVSQQQERYIVLLRKPEQKLRGSRQRELMAELERQSAPIPYSVLLKKHRGAGPALKKLVELGYVRIKVQPQSLHYLSSHQPPEWAKRNVELNAAQNKALAEINAKTEQQLFDTFLMHGVTGSGKTEVYIDAAHFARSIGKGILIIVPEIALTPQLIDRFVARLGKNIAVLHSAMSRRIRWNSWKALLEKKISIAIGARSAVFAPVPDLGLIIVDEEHDASFKQSDSLRYHARDLAVMRGKLQNCPVVLGSATPSLESFHNAVSRRYTYLSLPERHQSTSEVDVSLVDLNQKKSWEMKSKNLSPELFFALEDVLARNQQAFILYNRRGFASYLQCENCKEVLRCPNCSVTLTFHQNDNSLKCHYCNFQMIVSEYCPHCQGETAEKIGQNDAASSRQPGKLILRGAGTERIYDELQELFPAARIDRLDRDAASQAQKYRKILDDVRSGETQILVGTQMIAKGHDLPGVTLVGIIDCDVGLHMPDFRAGERVFQLLTQASGRAGRSKSPGRVILQTRVPNHLSLVKTVSKDYLGFARLELQNRQALNYPPFSRILRIIASATEVDQPQILLNEYRSNAVAWIKEHNLQVSVLGPCPAPLNKLRTHWRWHLLLKSSSLSDLHKVMQLLRCIKVPAKKLRIAFDLNPQDML